MNNTSVNSAKSNGLRYVSDEDLCFKRIKKGGRFFYLHPGGVKVKNKSLIERFNSLVIPPAWEEVYICSYENGHIQATGRDIRGRKQYIYHPKWEEISNTNKFNRLIEFGEALPVIRKRVEKDLRKKALIRDKVLAIIIKLLEETLIRVGNKIYAETNKSFGLTTLKDKHIKVKGSTLQFEFKGKSGKQVKIDYTDKRIAKLVKKCQDIPGQHLFQYYDEDGKRNPVESSDVNEYLNKIIAKDYTAKDFRTWGGTVTAAEVFYNMPPPENDKQNKSNIVKGIKRVAEALNNTPSICRKYYVHPHIIESYLDGYLYKAMIKQLKKNQAAGKYGLTPYEKVSLLILKKYSKN